MSVLTTLPPAFPAEEAAGLARDLYGLAGTLTPLDSERDQNFRLTEADGTHWVLKIANAAEGFEALDFQAALLRHVQGADAGLPLPHLRRPRVAMILGRLPCAQTDQEHFVRVVSWLPGQLYPSSRKDARLVRQPGRTCWVASTGRCRASAIPARIAPSTGTSARPGGRASACIYVDDAAQRGIVGTFPGAVRATCRRRAWRGCGPR